MNSILRCNESGLELVGSVDLASEPTVDIDLLVEDTQFHHNYNRFRAVGGYQDYTAAETAESRSQRSRRRGS